MIVLESTQNSQLIGRIWSYTLPFNDYVFFEFYKFLNQNKYVSLNLYVSSIVIWWFSEIRSTNASSFGIYDENIKISLFTSQQFGKMKFMYSKFVWGNRAQFKFYYRINNLLDMINAEINYLLRWCSIFLESDSKNRAF